MTTPATSGTSNWVTVYCSSTRSVDARYLDAAEATGRAIAGRGWGLVYGGNRVGSMGRLADGARAAGGKVVGITPRLFAELGNATEEDIVDHACDELLLVDTMRERKRLLEERGDALLTLPGGIGTLEEFFEVLVGRVLRQHEKPLVLLNLDGYYDPLLAMIEHAVEARFVKPQAWAQVQVAGSIDEAVGLIASDLDAIKK